MFISCKNLEISDFKFLTSLLGRKIKLNGSVTKFFQKNRTPDDFKYLDYKISIKVPARWICMLDLVSIFQYKNLIILKVEGDPLTSIIVIQLLN